LAGSDLFAAGESVTSQQSANPHHHQLEQDKGDANAVEGTALQVHFCSVYLSLASGPVPQL
jgi:hypothetical protein